MTSASEPRAAPRRQGRPTRDQRGIRREALLAAASKLLSGRSPDEITRAELSREAGIDPALVRYYFGDMSSLLTEGMIDIFKQLKSRRAVTTSDAPLREQLRLRLESLIEVLVAHPHLHQLLMRPVLHVEPDKAAEVEALRRDYTLASFDSLQSILSQAHAAGESIETDVKMFYVVMVGMSEFAVRCFQYFELLSATQGSRAETLSRFADFVADLLVDGLRPRG